MRHFMAQFGPALQWPWTRLTDVPELTDELLDRIVAQSDEQAAGRSVRELERVRDDCLVAILQALRSASFGAGERARAVRARPLRPRARHCRRPATTGRCACTATASAPSGSTTTGTRTRAATCSCFGDATDALLRHVGVDAAYLEAGGSYFTVETHLAFLHEARAGEAVLVETQVLGHDPKRLHLFHRLLRSADESELATAEQLLLHVDTEAAPRRAGRGRGAGARRHRSRSATPPCPGPRRPAAPSRWSGGGPRRDPAAERPAADGRPARRDARSRPAATAVVRAPHLQRLGEEGVVFERAYCASPLCVPSRAALMTGALPSRTGAYDNAGELPASWPTFAHYLRPLGYRTQLAGKMHFVGPDQLHGFEERLTTDVYPAGFDWVPDWRLGDRERLPWYHDMSSVAAGGPRARDAADRLRRGGRVPRAPGARRRGARARAAVPAGGVVHAPARPVRGAARLWERYDGVEIDPPAVPFLPPAEQRRALGAAARA